MEEVIESYKSALREKISEIREEISKTENIKQKMDNLREELSQWGRSNLNSMFLQLKSYIEEHNPKFIENNKEKWDSILDKAQALTEYGLYIAPLDLLKTDDKKIQVTYVGIGTFFATALFSKLISKKIKVFPALLTSALGGVGAYYLLGNSDEEAKNLAVEYVEDAHDWIKTAFENMYRAFQEAK